MSALLKNTSEWNLHKNIDRSGRLHRVIYLLPVLLLTILNQSVDRQVVSAPFIVNQTYAKSREPITLEEAFLGELRAKEFTFEWLASEEIDNELHDQLIYEDSKNILLVTLPPSERRNNSSSTTTSKTSPPTTNNFKPNVTILVSNSSFPAHIEFQGYKLSPSKRYLLLWNARRKQFRHSMTARFFLYDIRRDMISVLSTNRQAQNLSDGPFFEGEDESARFQLVDWYVTKTIDRTTDSLVMIQNNDIYNLYDVSRLITDKSERPDSSSGPVKLTYTGMKSVIFNGVPDWLYEEEILGDTPAFQVSPHSNHLAYMSFDDSRVNIMPYTIYGDQIIPRVQQIRYPKAGQPNPRVTVHILENLNRADGKSRPPQDIQLILPDDLNQRQHYINRINWLTDERLAIIWSNRDQNESFVVICSRKESQNQSRWNCEKNLHIKADNGWLDISDDLLPLSEDNYLMLMPKFEGSNVGKFKHIAKVSITKAESFVFLTSGHKEVISFNGIDYKRSLVYYTSTVVNEPGQRQLFVAELDGTSVSKGALNASLEMPNSSSSSVCVTCDHHPDECLYNFGKLSPTTNYYMFQCGGPDVPRTELRATRRRRHRNFRENLVNDTRGSKSLSSAEGDEVSLTGDNSNGQSSLLWTFEKNKELRAKLEGQKMTPTTMRLKVPIPNTEYMADVLLLIPSQQQKQRQDDKTLTGDRQKLKLHYLSPEVAKELYSNRLPDGERLPMVVDVYGGPGSQKVDYRFNINFGHFLASSKQVVYAMIDGRGSGFQGSKRLYELYHKLGTVEIQDQIEVAAQLSRSLSFIDPERVAIWGWSYGGYAAAMSLAQSQARDNQHTVAQYKSYCTTKNNTEPRQSQLTMQHGVFRCAASVAPVTNWIYYDTAYTEKYMSSPWLNERYDENHPGDHLGPVNQTHLAPKTRLHEHNFEPNKWTPLNRSFFPGPNFLIQNQLLELLAHESTNAITSTTATVQQPLSANTNSQMIGLNERYRRASLLDQMMNTDSKRFLLMHGTADDNVNFQQSIMLMKRMIRKNILFETRLYPDQDHGIANKPDKLHLGLTLSDFLSGCFSAA